MKDDESLEQASNQPANASQNEETTPGVFVVGIGKAAADKIAAAITKSLAPALARAIIEAFANMSKSDVSEEPDEGSEEPETIDNQFVNNLKAENRRLATENARLKNELEGKKPIVQNASSKMDLTGLPIIGSLFEQVGGKK